MKVNTISLNSVRLNTIALNHIGEIRSGGGGSKPSPIPQWIREHISFYYDMSKPMDVYHTDFTRWVINQIGIVQNITPYSFIINGNGTKNQSVIYNSSSNRWLNLSKGDKIQVEGATSTSRVIVTTVINGVYNNILEGGQVADKDGVYSIGIDKEQISQLNIEILDTTYSNLKITLLPSGKSVPTNEILKVSGYLQDLSGRKRNMKLNNFLFDMMSGVDGYNNEAFNKSVASSFKWELIDSRTIKGKTTQVFTDFGYYHIKDVTNNVMHINWHIDGIQEGNKVYLTQYMYNNFKIELHNGDNHVALDVSENTDRPNYFYVSVISDQPYSTDITITQIPEYPGALVTDGVDDYGLVEGLSSGVKMLFMTVNPIGDFNISKMYYSQRKDPIRIDPFYIFTMGNNNIAYAGNPSGVTYINGVLNKSIKYNELFRVKHTITTVNANVKPETSKAPSFFWEEGNTKNYCSKLAFYNSIAFDSIPTEADGFTEQELIDYVLTNIIGQ